MRCEKEKGDGDLKDFLQGTGRIPINGDRAVVRGSGYCIVFPPLILLVTTLDVRCQLYIKVVLEYRNQFQRSQEWIYKFDSSVNKAFTVMTVNELM